jgi:hypothetical protein
VAELPSQVSSIAQVIQLAVAPVFLLAGVGALLGVLINRLGRIIDRFHVLQERIAASLPLPSADPDDPAGFSALSRRARLIHWAITLCTSCELLVCLVIAALFVGSELRVDLSSLIAGLFIAAMLALTLGLACFLREIALATRFIQSLGRTASRYDADA